MSERNRTSIIGMFIDMFGNTIARVIRVFVHAKPLGGLTGMADLPHRVVSH